MHIDSIGIESPATDDLDVTYFKISAADGSDIVDQGIADRDAVYLDVRAIIKLNRVSSLGISNILLIVFSVYLEEYPLSVAAVVKDTPAENFDIFCILCVNATVNQCAFINKNRLIAFQSKHTYIVDAFAKIQYVVIRLKMIR